MRVRRFCLVVWSLTVCSIIVFLLLFGRRRARAVATLKFSQADALHDRAATDRWRAVLARRLGAAPATSARTEEGAQAWLDEYRELVAQDPDLRAVLVLRLADRAFTLRGRVHNLLRSPLQAERDALTILSPAALEEIHAMRSTDPENAVWPILLLAWELGGALERVRDLPDDRGPPGQWWQTFRMRDPQALHRATALARQHSQWTQADWQLNRQSDLIREAVKDLDLGPYEETAGLRAMLVPGLNQMRGIHRRCIFLGYESLQRGDREEARLWFETSLAVGQSRVSSDNLLIEALVEVLIVGETCSALRDWEAGGGDFLAAGRMAKRRTQVLSVYKPMTQHRHRFAFGAAMQALMASAYTMGSSAAAAALCALVSFAALGHLAAERRVQRRTALPVPDLRWRVLDTFWIAAVAVTPALLLTAVLICFRLALGPGASPNLNLSVNLVVVAVAMAVPTLLAGLSSRRIWRRLQEAGGTGKPSVFWPVLVWTVLIVLAAIIFLGRPLGLTGHPTQAGPPAGGVVIPLVLGATLVGVAGFAFSAIRAIARRGPSVAERAARTAWVVRAFTLATLVLVLFTLSAALITADRFDACWREAADVLRAETTHYLGRGWVKRYFGAPAETATQPVPEPVPEPNDPDPSPAD